MRPRASGNRKPLVYNRAEALAALASAVRTKPDDRSKVSQEDSGSTAPPRRRRWRTGTASETGAQGTPSADADFSSRTEWNVKRFDWKRAMPMIDLYIPEGALEPRAEMQLLRELADLLIGLEGFDPENERARAVTWTFLHRPQVFVAGAPARSPRYRAVLAVPEGQYDAAVRSAVVREVTEAFARAEGGPLDEVSKRVWVFPTEIPDGSWGSRGQVQRLPDIMAFLEGDEARSHAEKRLEDRDRTDAARILAAAFDAVAEWP